MERVEGGATGLSKKTYYTRKIKKATHLLFYTHHRKPGVKGWELKKKLGSDYPKVLKVLDRHLGKLDLEIKTVFDGREEAPEKPTVEQLNRARFYITLRGELEPKESKMMGWRIDDIAGLAVSISLILSKKGRAPREEVEKVLRNKLPDWQVKRNIERYIRYGYLDEDENKQLYLDWRTRAEIDRKALVNLLLGSETQNSEVEETAETN